MLVELLKAILIGFIASVPPGPVAMLVIQRTFCHGRAAGIASGVGSAVIDTLYAVVSLFALMIVENFISANAAWIFVGGGLLVAVIGFTMFRRKPIERLDVCDTTKTKAVQYAFQAAGCALANPGALAYMFAIVALFRLDLASVQAPIWLIVLFVFIGAMLWWLSVAISSDKMRNNFKINTLNRVNKITAAAVMVFGLVLVVRGVILLI